MSGQIPVKTSAEGLAASVEKATKSRGKPPVHLWNPDYSGEIDIQILRDGSWIHEGGKINRLKLVQLFASILRKEGDRYFLVTPVEKLGITVEDVPFVAVDMHVTGEGSDQVLVFDTNVEDSVTSGASHPVVMRQNQPDEDPTPYLMVRDGLEARIDRKSFYRMVELGTHHHHESTDWFGVWSDGQFFPLIPSSDLT